MFIPLRTDVPLRRTPWMNWALMLANVLVFAAQLARPDLTKNFDLNPRDPQILHYFTYAFLHATPLHLLGNMLFLYIFGNNVNDRLGHVGYLGFYLAGGVIAGAAHVLSDSAPVIGASGAVFAVTGAFLILFPRAHVTLLYFFVLIGVAEIASMWFILAYFALNVVNQFSVMMGGSQQVAYTAHIGGALFGSAACMLMLALRLLPRDAFDVISMIDRWNRRRQFRDMVASGYDPFGYVPPKRSGPADPNQERIQEVRATIAEAMARGNLPEAVKGFMELRAIDPAQVLSRQNQLDLANHLFGIEQHAAAADAYEGYLRQYPKADQADHVLLMLGLLYARYLNRPDKAAPVLEQATQRLRNERDIELAREELAKIAGTAAR